MKKFFLLLLFSACFAENLMSQSTENQLFGDFTVGTTSGYAPYVSLNEQGDYEGFDIDFAKALSLKLNRRLVIKDFGSMPGLMLALKQGKVDALIWAISITEERAKKMEIIYYQGEKITEIPFLFWGKIPEEVQTIADFSKKVISVEAGTYQEDILKKYPQINLKYNDKIMDGLLEIKFGKSFATIIDPSLVNRITKQYPEVKVLNLPLPAEAQSLGNGVCLVKTNQELIALVRKAVEELTQEGLIEQLEKKWELKPNG